MSDLVLESISRDEDPRGITVTLSLLGERFEDHYLDMKGDLAPSMRSPMNFTREEMVVHDLVTRWRAGAPIDLPVPIEAPPPEALPPRERRRGSYLDTPLVRKQIARDSATPGKRDAAGRRGSDAKSRERLLGHPLSAPFQGLIREAEVPAPQGERAHGCGDWRTHHASPRGASTSASRIRPCVGSLGALGTGTALECLFSEP